MNVDVEQQSHEYNDEFKSKLEKLIIDILLNDDKTVPYIALRYKLIKNLRADGNNTYITDEYVAQVLGGLIEKQLIGISKSHRYYIDCLDWPLKNEDRLTGIFKINSENGNGLICKCKTPLDKHHATHFVHTKNFVEGIKNNDFVEFVELDISAKKSQQSRKSKYIDAKILQKIDKAPYYKEIGQQHQDIQKASQQFESEVSKDTKNFFKTEKNDQVVHHEANSETHQDVTLNETPFQQTENGVSKEGSDSCHIEENDVTE